MKINPDHIYMYLYLFLLLIWFNYIKKNLMYFLFSLKHFYELILNIIYYGAL